MKYVLAYSFGILTMIVLAYDYENLKDESRRLRRERDMYDLLYRKANTKLSNFQDSINIHCICK